MDSATLRKQGLEVLGMLMVGDGVMTALQLDRHLKLWRGWSGATDRCIDAFLRWPNLTRFLGVVEFSAGVALSAFQTNGLPKIPGGKHVPSTEESAFEMEQVEALTRE